METIGVREVLMLITVAIAVATTVFNAGIAWGLFRSMRDKMTILEKHLPSIVILSEAVKGIKEVLDEMKESLYVSFQGRINHLENRMVRIEATCEATCEKRHTGRKETGK